VIPSRDPSVLIMRYDWRNNWVLFVHNLDAKPHEFEFSVGLEGKDAEHGRLLVNLLAEDHSHAGKNGRHRLVVEGYATAGTASEGWIICFGAARSICRQNSEAPRLQNRPMQAGQLVSRMKASPSNLAMQRALWWQTGVIYQIYPRSFQDSNGDGIGDLPGITRRLQYLIELGVDAIWLSPIFPSPMVDFGYDISDYTGIDPLFGSLDDFDALLQAAHAQGLKVILDLVPNHTSDQHPWFRESLASQRNSRRDWYIWRDPGKDGGPPNNWLSQFGGSAWQYDRASGQYYYHAFLAAQPDLNWRNQRFGLPCTR
jgi:hypothetical protein